jgi:hypothetical protein
VSSAGNSGLGCGGPRCAAFGKGLFESGVAAKVLREFAQDPFPYLDEAEKKQMMSAQEAQRGPPQPRELDLGLHGAAKSQPKG